MFEAFTGEARTVVFDSQEHARRLGHRFIGCEHLLLAIVTSDEIAAIVLRDRGVRPDVVEEQIVTHIGLGTSSGLFAGLDKDALATIGIDVDVVRARIEGAFGAAALAHAEGWAKGSRHRRSWVGRVAPKAFRGDQRQLGGRDSRSGSSTARYRALRASGRCDRGRIVPDGHLPLTARAKRSLERAGREAVIRRDAHIGPEHLALGLLHETGGMIPLILGALDVSPAELRSAVEFAYRQAS